MYYDGYIYYVCVWFVYAIADADVSTYLSKSMIISYLLGNIIQNGSKTPKNIHKCCTT